MNDENHITKTKNKLEQRFKNNSDFIKRKMPVVYQLINKGKPNLTLDPNTGRIELYKDGKSIYEIDALTFSMKEVAHFESLMDQTDYRVSPTSLPLAHLIQPEPFKKTVQEYAKSYVLSKSEKPAYLDTIIFGIGLGHHIEILCNKRLFHHHTIIEKDVTQFIASLYCVNWENIVNNMTHSQSLTILVKDPEVTDQFFHDQINLHFTNMFPANFNATMIYNHARHLQYEDYKEIKESFDKFSHFSQVSYEKLGPDCQRLMNANENCRLKKPIIDLNKSNISNEDIKIAIVGAGPSLDDYIISIKQKRDKLIIISCGSSLESLLKNGITPDFHFELEFLNLASSMIKELSKEHKLSDIDLLCSFEGNPGYSKYFRNTFQFVQETNELVNNIDAKYILRFGGLTCTNGASALFTRICKNDMLFFGMDFAFTHGEHHAKDNISNKTVFNEEFKAFEGFGEKLKKTGVLEAEDVHGEILATNPSFNSARFLLQRMISLSNSTYYNCSNGANIEGSEYLSVEALNSKLDESPIVSERFTLTTDVFDSDEIHNISKSILETSFDVSRQYLENIKLFKDISREDACIRIINIVKSTNLQLVNRVGQSRSIMSINRLPLLLLFNSINHCSNDFYQSLLDTWISDYESYLDYIHKKLFTPFEKNDFYIREEWLDSF
ncbi:hypothetical protein NBRC116188_17110 [Oceaniserpentilla sp. 4NH20-0058]|uniref:6-hydroxymethylpterin diphosphokinase MptE-like protein n=1 Tax=Oceaniserpentilla sp. 4NH20-0058 TaxID=3127660 RepID=UPI0031034C0D